MSFSTSFSSTSNYHGVNNLFLKQNTPRPGSTGGHHTDNLQQQHVETFRLEIRVFPPPGKAGSGNHSTMNHASDPNTTLNNIKKVMQSITSTYPPIFIHSINGALTIRARHCYQQQTDIGWDLATFRMMDNFWASTIPDPTLWGTGEKWQTKVTKWLIDSAYLIWVQHNTERHTPNQAEVLNAQLLETQAQIRKVYALAETNLTIHDRHELIKEHLDERLALPETTNRIWATQLLRLIWIRIKHNSTRTNLTDKTILSPNTEMNKLKYRNSLSRRSVCHAWQTRLDYK